MFVARLIARGGGEEEGKEMKGVFVDSNNSRAMSLLHLAVHIDI